ncbi:DEAD/DEAH box helicase [Stenotrophomonas sp. SMYL20]|uniref:DEAD/DEAH box helicase n=1 Tax=Stenotrophomonas sp. SMYL20 TaxID=3076043 RepID=UPI002E78AD35|nr:DEAD/DEAH box helicase [Stenotrophomonas sp. SMYL20]
MNDPAPIQTLSKVLEDLHKNGPDSQEKLEAISLYREFHPQCFERFEQDIIASMGLFYKLGAPESLYSFLISRMGEANRVDGDHILTPVQASLVSAIRDHNLVSISAPTSAGKSYSIRDFISKGEGDAVIVVPSRALIAEYVGSLRQYFSGEKGVMVMPFVDSVFKARSPRKILVLTPERAREIFDNSLDLNIRVFFFDEAQVSEEGMRGVVFDHLVRRVSKDFPNAKMIFAHPFVANPDAQFKKHGFDSKSAFSRSYEQGAVGKIFIQRHSNGKDYYFSPFADRGNLLSSCIEFQGGFSEFAFSSGKSILAYVSKQSIYDGKFMGEFESYVGSLPSLSNEKALSIIDEISQIVGANHINHRSKMIELLRKGVVIHHGSVPLEVRFMLEDYIRLGYCRICFATSTLAQGVNMPFDVVWLNTMSIRAEDEAKRSLAFKNLIGRAGRLSDSGNFDFGYVYTKSARLLMDRLKDEYRLSDESVIEFIDGEAAGHDMEVVEAIRDSEFDDELHIPNSRAARLQSSPSIEAMNSVLGLLYVEGTPVKQALRGDERRTERAQLEAGLRLIYEAYMGRALYDGESAVFKEAIFILIQSFSGRTFREIVGMRYSSISRRDERDKVHADFSQPATTLPDSALKRRFSLYPENTPKSRVSYDVVMFDTYDYLDKVISFSLFDVFAAAARIYYSQTKDERAQKFIELLRFGTNDQVTVLLMRYGFLPDQIEELIPHVLRISDEEIVFKRSVSDVNQKLRPVVDWYL